MSKDSQELSQRERMLGGQLYEAWDAELSQMRTRARRLLRAFNQSTEEERDKRSAILKELLGAAGEDVYIEPPFHCDYGTHIKVGKGFYMNFDCVILDCAMVEIGDNVLCAPKGPELAKPIKIGNNVWLGGGVIVCPGVTIGDNTTIGAGSVVTKDIPANVMAAGNPCRVIKQLTPPPEAPATAPPTTNQ